MDRLIKPLAAERDADLALCLNDGVAYQADMSAARVAYGSDYLAKVDAYDGTEIALAVNAGRCALLKRYLRAGAKVLDVGAGSGAFVRAARAAGFDARGFEVMPEAVDRLEAAGLYDSGPYEFDAVTFWDVLEHMEDPGPSLASVRRGSFAFASVPVFEDLWRIRESKHYRPGEHLYYWTPAGFAAWMGRQGFRLMESSGHEVDAGRESIGAYAFWRTHAGAA